MSASFTHQEQKKKERKEDCTYLVPRSDEMVDDMGGGSVSSGTAKPFATCKTLDNTGWRVNPAVAGKKRSNQKQSNQLRKGPHLRAGMLW
jgi:hypothetical protein